MLAKISSGKSVFGVLNYNKIKIDEQNARILFRNKMFDSADGKFSMKDCMDSFYTCLAANKRTEKVVFHASLNPNPKNKLTNNDLARIAKRYMDKLGYGNQPYIVFKHSDIKREHLHIVSVRIDENGKKINDSYEVARSMKICKELEQEFNLVPLVRGERETETPIGKINYKEGDIKHQAEMIAKAIMKNFYFQSFGEYRTVLEQFNLTAEEVKGENNGKDYNGILYSVTDDKGNRQGKPFKSSMFCKEVGYNALQQHFEVSKLAVEKKNIREQLRPKIAEAMRKARNIDDFRKLLKANKADVIFRINDEKRIYGATFIDYQNRAVLNGSRLGKDFSANVFNEMFNNTRQVVESETKSTEIKNDNNIDLGLSSVLGLFDFSNTGADYEDENVAVQQANALRKKKKTKRRGMRM
jgi:hypothetical protein